MPRILLALLLGLRALPAVDHLSEAQALKLAFPEAVSIEPIRLEPDADQARAVLERARSTARGKLGSTWIAQGPDGVLGVAYIDHVIGRTEFITFLCVIGADGRIQRLAVMSYREPIGGEVKDERWLRQFVGKGPDDPLQRGKPIVNIGGATLSVEALTERTRFLLDLHHVVVRPMIADRIAAGAGPVRRAAALGDSPLNVAVHGGDPTTGARAAEAALAEAARLDLVLNRWNPDSELAALNRTGSIAPSTGLLAGLQAARNAWEETGGRFDPTVGPLILAWKQAHDSGTAPDPAELARLRGLIGFARIGISADQVSLPEGAVLDLGGIAKGLILDAAGARAATLLAPDQHLLLDAGGSSQLLVAVPGRQAEVIIDLRHPARPEELARRVRLQAGQGLGCASGVGRVFRIDGTSHSHLIDPLSGRPGPLERAAWVVADSAGRADGLDTALCLMAIDEALALIEGKPDLACLLWDGHAFHASSRWPEAPAGP